MKFTTAVPPCFTTDSQLVDYALLALYFVFVLGIGFSPVGQCQRAGIALVITIALNLIFS